MTQWGLDNLFNPGKRHMDDEKRRLQSTREEVGDASGGRRIDLDGGKVSIRLPRPAATEEAAESGALDPALEVDEFPAVALTNDEAEIEPEVVDETTSAPDGATADEPDASAAPDPEPPPAAAEPAAPRRRQVSADAWSRRG